MEYDFINEHKFENYYRVEYSIAKLPWAYCNNIECIDKKNFTIMLASIMDIFLNNPDSKAPYSPILINDILILICRIGSII